MLLLLRDIGEIVAGTRCEIGVVKLQTVTYGRAKGHKLCGAGARRRCSAPVLAHGWLVIPLPARSPR